MKTVLLFPLLPRDPLFPVPYLIKDEKADFLTPDHLATIPTDSRNLESYPKQTEKLRSASKDCFRFVQLFLP